MKKLTLAALSAIGFTIALGGCIDTRTVPVDYGPQVEAAKIIDALNTPTENMDPTAIQLGEFVAAEVTQDIALGASYSIVGDVGKTVTTREEDSLRIIYGGITHEISYKQDGTYQKTSKEGDFLCVSKVAGGCGEDLTSASTPASAAIPLKTEAVNERNPSIFEPLTPVRSQSALKSFGFVQPAKVLAAAAATTQAPTYHHLKTWITRERPPIRVQQSNNCEGIAGCLINLHHIEFDEVYWDKPEGTKVHYEVTMSPDVPFLSRNMGTCQSLLVDIGDNGSNILLKQCTNVFDFAFKLE